MEPARDERDDRSQDSSLVICGFVAAGERHRSGQENVLAN
jgi:hypothetical protein